MTQTAPARLWNRHFLLWWLGSAQSAFGSALAGIALSFLVLHQTGKVSAMGINLALELLPALLSPLLGPLVDRWPIKLPLVIGNLLRGVLQLAVGLVALRGTVPLGFLYAVSFCTGLVAAFYAPASMGVTRLLVPAAELPRAVGLMQGTNQSMQMVGLVGGGLLIALLGRAQALVLDGASFLLFAGLIALVAFPARQIAAQQSGYLQDLRAGLKYVRASLVLVSLPLTAMVLNAAFAPLDMLIPKRMLQLGAGEAGYGLFFGLSVAGMAAGSFVVAALGPRLRPNLAAVTGLAVAGLLLLGLARSQTAWQMYVLAALLGVGLAFCNAGVSLIFQQRVAPEYFGRVGSLLNMFGGLGQPLTLLALAPLADHLPIGRVFAVQGVLTLLAALVWNLVLRRETVATPVKNPS